MPEVSDVDLMELADGTLPEPRRRMVEAELARHPELRQRLEAFLVTGKAMARLFDPVIEAPLPPALLETIQRDPAPPRVLPFGSERARAQRRARHAGARSAFGWVSASAMALAAAMVVAVGIVAVLYAVRSNDGGMLADPQMAAAPMALALEKTPSAQPTELVLDGLGSGILKVEASFQHVDGRYCREYVFASASSQGFVGYACRVGDARWRIEKQLATVMAKKPEAPAPTAKPGAPKTVKPAGEPKSSHSDPSVQAVDQAINAVMRGDTIQSDKEQSLIGSGWRSEGK